MSSMQITDHTNSAQLFRGVLKLKFSDSRHCLLKHVGKKCSLLGNIASYFLRVGLLFEV